MIEVSRATETLPTVSRARFRSASQTEYRCVPSTNPDGAGIHDSMATRPLRLLAIASEQALYVRLQMRQARDHRCRYASLREARSFSADRSRPTSVNCVSAVAVSEAARQFGLQMASVSSVMIPGFER